ncbi:MAG: phosphonoacetaldehyde hydrolase [Ruminococcus sp.]|nr:phosphonoacetaldehyde hydrolase [Ruminococcus sp.]
MSTENTIKLAVFDWAGTTVDYGSSAPMVVFEEVFAKAGITLTRAEINGPMGMEKKTHIRSLLSLETASEQWKNKYGREWNDNDVETLYNNFENRLVEVAAEYSTPIDGVLDAVAELREMGVKIGSTTGYNAEMMKNVLPGAGRAGYTPDCVVTPDITGKGRPSPFMLFECMRQLGVYPVKSVVKVGDTIADILEGKNAGAWSIGILTGSNLLGLTEDEYNSMDADSLAKLKAETTQKYIEAGADMVIDNMRELPAAIEKLSEVMAKERS